MSATTSIFIVLIYHIYSPLSEEINCENNWSASQCYHKEISCTANATICSINCNGDGSCEGSKLNCNTNSNTECNINCNGRYSCTGATTESQIICPSNASCTIHCNGDYSCDNIHIDCPSTSNCTINGNGKYALPNSRVLCPNNGKCLINCNNVLSCYDSTYDARALNTSQLIINCENNKNACKNMHVGCPKAINNIKRCAIYGDEGTIHDGINLYAVNSWDDIDLSLFTAKTGPGDDSQTPKMHCGTDLRESCVLSYSAWNCKNNTNECFREGIKPFPTPMPTKSPSTPDNVEPWYAVVGILVGIFFFCLFVILGWVYCVRQQQKEKTKYETLDQAPDPDADIMQKEHEHMYRTDIPNTKNLKPMDIVTKGGLHIVNDYSDASKIGGLLPISEEKTNEKTLSSKSHIVEERKQNNNSLHVEHIGVTVIESENNESNATEMDKLIGSSQEQTGVVVDDSSNITAT